MFVIWLLFLLTFFLLVSLSLVSSANGAGPSALSPVQSVLKPVAAPLVGFIGAIGIIAVIWGGFLLIREILDVLRAGFSFSVFINLITAVLLIGLGSLAGYVSVAAFFGAPASGAGKFIDWIKRSFGGVEAILGLLGLLLALWLLVQFILARSGVYI